MDKVPAQVCNKRLIESLVKAGAFDEMKHGRRALLAIHEQAVDQYVDIKRNEAIGQDSLFGGLDADDGGFGVNVVVPDIEEWDKKTLLGHEREMLGLYVSDHPLTGLEHVLANAADCTIGQLLTDEDRPDELAGDHLRPDHRGHPEDHQDRQRLGDRHRRGPRGCDRRTALPQRLPARQHPARRGHRGHGPGPARPEQGPARAARQVGLDPGDGQPRQSGPC